MKLVYKFRQTGECFRVVGEIIALFHEVDIVPLHVLGKGKSIKGKWFKIETYIWDLDGSVAFNDSFQVVQTVVSEFA